MIRNSNSLQYVYINIVQYTSPAFVNRFTLNTKGGDLNKMGL